MKKLILLGILVVSGLAFGRDNTYNEKRDIIVPIKEKISEKKVEGVKAITPKEIEAKSAFYSQISYDD